MLKILGEQEEEALMERPGSTRLAVKTSNQDMVAQNQPIVAVSVHVSSIKNTKTTQE